MAGMILEFASKKKGTPEVDVEVDAEGPGAAAKAFADALAAVKSDPSDDNGHALYEAIENLRAACEGDVSEDIEDEDDLGRGRRPPRRHRHEDPAAGEPRKFARFRRSICD